MEEFIIQQIIAEGTLNHKSSVWRMDRMFDEDFQKDMIKKFFEKVWGVFAVVGNLISGMIGLYFCYNLVKVSLGQVVQTYNVYQIVGFTRDFILSWLPIIGKHVLIKNLRKRADFWREKDATKEYHTDLAKAPFPEIELEEEKEEEPCRNMTIYPNVHVNELSNGYIPTTNAIRVNGCNVATLIDTGACYTFININSFPKDMVFLNKRPYTGKTIVSASGHEVKTITEAEAYFVI